MIDLEVLKLNPDFKVIEIIKPEMYCLKVMYKDNIIYDRGTFHCKLESCKKYKEKFTILLDEKLRELKLIF